VLQSVEDEAAEMTGAALVGTNVEWIE
jgi:hypothetical protein